MPSVSNLRADVWKVTIGGTEQEFEATVALAGGYDAFDVRSQKTGTDILASLVQGRQFDVTFEIVENVAAVLLRGLGLSGAGDALDIGDQLPVSEVLLHPADADDTDKDEDIGLYAVRFGRLERSADGQGTATWKLTGMALRTSAGKVFWQGAKPA